MIKNLMHYCCPICKAQLTEEKAEIKAPDDGARYLKCNSCLACTPLINGFAFFDQPTKSAAFKSDISENKYSLIKPGSVYKNFVRLQSQRPVYDPYSAYLPFNEALLGFLRLSRLIKMGLSPGQLILDLNCRTGWTGELLAALFPEQQIISILDGNRGALGYSGYSYWLPKNLRARNLDIIFHSDVSSLPFPDHTFDLVFGHDFLHHFTDKEQITEFLRVSKPDCPLIFPHVHTNHSDPDPYFERGGTLISGKDWCNKIAQIPNTGSRKPCVVSELSLFDSPEFLLHSDPDTQHYNCCVMVIPEKWFGKTLAMGMDQNLTGEEYIFTHPLVEFGLSTGSVSLATTAMDGGGNHLFDRHPGVKSFLLKQIDIPLSEYQCRILYWAGKGLSCAEIALRMEIRLEELFNHVNELHSRKLILLIPVSYSMFLLQHFLRFRYPLKPQARQTFQSIWDDVASIYEENPVLINYDGSEFSIEHTRLFVNATRNLLLKTGAKKGDHLLIASGNHSEVFFTCWAAWIEGMVVVLVNPDFSAHEIEKLIAKLKIKVAFTSETVHLELAIPQIEFDGEDANAAAKLAGGEQTFSAAIEPYIGMESQVPPGITENDPALLLCTSGSTGNPKTVQLSHGSLYRSGESLGRIYNWQCGERMLSLGPVHSMSGIRNPAVSAIQTGATIIVPSPMQQKMFTHAIRLIDQFSVNIVTTVPAFLENICAWIDEGRTLPLSDLRLLLTTASRIGKTETQKITDHLDIEVADYYGLTETGGICILQLPGRTYEVDSVGHPENCIIEIRDQHENKMGVGHIGHMHIYGDNLMLGYLESHKSGLRFKDGWLATGDKASILASGEIKLHGRLDGAQKNRQGEFQFGG